MLYIKFIFELIIVHSIHLKWSDLPHNRWQSTMIHDDWRHFHLNGDDDDGDGNEDNVDGQDRFHSIPFDWGFHYNYIDSRTKVQLELFELFHLKYLIFESCIWKYFLVYKTFLFCACCLYNWTSSYIHY